MLQTGGDRFDYNFKWTASRGDGGGSSKKLRWRYGAWHGTERKEVHALQANDFAAFPLLSVLPVHRKITEEFTGIENTHLPSHSNQGEL